MKTIQSNVVFGDIGPGLRKVLAHLNMFQFAEAEAPKSFFELKNLYFKKNTRLIFIGRIPRNIERELVFYLRDHIDDLNHARCTISFICLRKNIEMLCTFFRSDTGYIEENQKTLKIAG